MSLTYREWRESIGAVRGDTVPMVDYADYLLEQREVLLALDVLCVVAFTVKEGGTLVEVVEMCDHYYTLDLTKTQAQGMIRELQTLVDTMVEE